MNPTTDHRRPARLWRTVNIACLRVLSVLAIVISLAVVLIMVGAPTWASTVAHQLFWPLCIACYLTGGLSVASSLLHRRATVPEQ